MSEKEEKSEKCAEGKKKWHENYDRTFGWIYFLGIIGAAVYYIQESQGFWMGVLGILKAIIWPAMLIYKVFMLIQM